MAKLSKTEIEALAKKIQSEIPNAKQEKINEIVNSDEYKNFEISEIVLKFKDICKELGIGNEYSINSLINSAKNKLINTEEIESIKNIPSVSEITNMLIIEQIEKPNLEDLIKNVKESIESSMS